MGGVFLYQTIRRVLFCLLLTAILWTAFLITDREKLTDSLIRFHVIANSDSDEDQQIKLKVRDAVLSGIQEDLASVSDVSEARAYLEENLPKIRDIVRKTLNDCGVDVKSNVSLCRERFHARHYETFSLPAGVYDSLKIMIGEAEGRNWWCVAFPTLCLPATTDGFEAAAAGAGFSSSIVRSLTKKDGISIQFYLLDWLGELENIFFQG